MKTITRCPLCHSESLEQICQPVDFLVTRSVFNIVRCPQCTLSLTSPQPDKLEIGAYYESEDYIAHSGKSDGWIAGLYKGVRWFTLRRKRNLITRVSGVKAGEILDYGCGSGEFLKTCQDSGWTVTGVDPGPVAREKAAQLLGITILKPEAMYSFPPERFDVITLWHVLEHVHDPVKVFTQLCRSLKPGGILVIAVPNYTATDARWYGARWAAWDVPRHLFHFSPHAMKTLVASTGMRFIALKRMLFDPFYVALLTEQSVRERGRLVRGLLVGVYSWLTSLMVKERSSSLTYLLRKE